MSFKVRLHEKVFLRATLQKTSRWVYTRSNKCDIFIARNKLAREVAQEVAEVFTRDTLKTCAESCAESNDMTPDHPLAGRAFDLHEPAIEHTRIKHFKDTSTSTCSMSGRKRVAAAAAPYIIAAQKKQRTTWVRDWIGRRADLGAVYNFHRRLDHFSLH